MARNGSGTFSSPYPNFVSGTVISSTQVDANNSDIATALTQSIAVDGQSTVTANLPMNAKKLTGVGAGSAATDSLNLGQAQAEAMVWCGTAGGSANALTLSPTPAITAYAAGQRFVWKASGSVNTGATTVAISGLGTIALQDNGSALAAGQHQANRVFMGILDTTSTVQVTQVQISGTDPLIVTSLTVSGTATIGGILSVDDTTTSTSGTTGSIHTDGGLGVAGTAFVAGAATVGGASQFNSTVTVGVNDTGYDVQFFGATSGAHMLWDESADDLKLVGAAGLTVAGNIDVDGTTNLDAVDIDGATQIDATLSVGVDDQGYDVKFFGDTASAYMLWDTSADDLILGGAAQLGIGTTAPTALVTAIGTLGTHFIASQSQANDTAKYGAYAIPHYHNAEENLALVVGLSNGTDNTVYMGGGVGELNAATILSFNTAANDATVTGTERMRITAAGNVGIGTTAPGYLLTASKNGGGGDSGQLMRVTDTNTSNSVAATSLTIGIINHYASAPRMAIAGERGLTFCVGDGSDFNTQRKVDIDASGKVGIGTTSPSQKFVVSNAGADNIVMAENSSASIQMFMQAASATGSVGTLTNHPVQFLENNSEKMRITGGNVLVGTTANIAANAKIFAFGSGVGIALGYGTGSAEYRHFYMNSGDGAMYVFNNTNYGSFSAAGAWTNASDRRIKKNIVDIKYGLADVLKIQPRSYQMKEVAGDYIGLIAQEMEEIIPEVVSGDPEKQLTLDYGSLVAVAFKAIQEQQVIIESLKTRITALEG